jgi:helix-turn-helix protein
MKTTQRQQVLEKLKSDGEVSNVWAVQHHIFRLSERIRELKEEGYGIDAEYIPGTKTYEYTLNSRPKQVVYVPVDMGGYMAMRPRMV